jgi:hypothetical protein
LEHGLAILLLLLRLFSSSMHAINSKSSDMNLLINGLSWY